MSDLTFSMIYGEAQLATRHLKGMLDNFRNPLGEPPILVGGLARREVEARYALALEAEQKAKRDYENEILILVAPYPAYGFVGGARTIQAEFKVLGTRATVPTDTSADILIYGVSELGLADHKGLAEMCSNLLINTEKTEYLLSISSDDARAMSDHAIAAAKAHYAVRTILSTAPRLGFLRLPKGAATGGAGAGARAAS